MDLGLKDRHVLVTGGSRSIGATLAKAFALEGATVTAVARNQEQLEQLSKTLTSIGVRHNCIAKDLSEEGCAAQMVEEAVATLGPIEVVCHNLGGSLGIKDTLAPLKDWERVWRFNVGIAIDINNAILPPMVRARWGRIVMISSRVAVEFGGAAPYAAAKAYLNAYTVAMGRAYAEKGVLINAIMPSAVRGDGNAWDKAATENPKFVEAFLEEHQSIGRLGEPDDICPFALLLASNANTFAAGSLVSVDGGSK